MAQWVNLYRTGHDGFGDYQRQSEQRYHLSGGGDARLPGRLGLCPPSFRAEPGGHKDTCPGAVVWADDNGLAFFAPVGGYLIRSGHTTAVEDLEGTSRALGIALHDDGSGNDYLYVSFGAADFICRRASDASFSQDDDVKTLQLESLDDGRLVRVVTGGYQISFCPAGSDPFTTANWGTGITVGRPHDAINALCHIGDAVIVCKPDGAYAYNPVNSTFINLTPSIAHHPDNGKGAANVAGLGVLMPLANGDVVHIDQGLRAGSVGPGNNALPGRDTPMSRITAIVYAGEWGYAYQEPFHGKSRGSGITGTSGLGTAVMTYDESATTYTDYSTAATDNNPDTVVELSGLGGASQDDYLYVGANYPFEGCFLTIAGVNATASSGFDTVAYYDGDSWESLTLVDLTYTDGRATTTCSLVRDGYLGWSDRNIPALMAKGTVNSLSKYWVRFHFDQTAAVDA